MDGFAVRASELPGELPIAGVVAAGATPDDTLSPGTCLKIMTGAPIPAGADAVVMREMVEEDQGRARFAETPKPGAHIRRAGEDVETGSLLLEAGSVLGPGELAILAAQGISEVEVIRRPRVVILSTGNELVPLGATPSEGQIINSNNITLAAQIRDSGAIAIDAGIVGDSLAGTIRALRAAYDYDVLITSGGVSVGDFDYVKDAFAEVGMETKFWKVAVKPGKPVAFCTRSREGGARPQLVFGLPGNPASSLVSFELFVRPLLRQMMGYKTPQRDRVQVKLESGLKKDAGRTHFVRAQVRRDGDALIATPLRKQGSGMLRSMVSVDCLLVLDAEKQVFEEGSLVPAIALRGCR
jgi:molybdopterin molybdotransferase